MKKRILSQSCKFASRDNRILIADVYSAFMEDPHEKPLFQQFVDDVKKTLPAKRLGFLYDVDVRDRLQAGALTIMVRGDEAKPLSLSNSSIVAGFIGEQGDVSTVAARLSIHDQDRLDTGKGLTLGITTGVTSPRFNNDNAMKKLASAVKAVSQFNNVARVVSTVDIVNFPAIAANLDISIVINVQIDRLGKPELVFLTERRKGIRVSSSGICEVDMWKSDGFEKLCSLFKRHYVGIGIQRTRLLLAPRIF